MGATVLMPASVGGSADWLTKQEGSIERYNDERYNRDTTIPRLFGGFISTTLPRDGVVLDIGCGISPEIPPYVSELGLIRYLGLEPLQVAVERDYPCVVGAVAENLPVGDRTVDGLLFATSLDHIENVRGALEEARRVLKQSGRAYLWVGLHEPEIVSRTMAPIHSWIYAGSALRRAASLLVPHAVLARALFMLAARSYKLRRGLPLDHAHHRYYTRKSLRAELVSYGFHPEREVLVPGSNSLFVECTLAC